MDDLLQHVRTRLDYWQRRMGLAEWTIDVTIRDEGSLAYLNFGDIPNRKGYLSLSRNLDNESVDWILTKCLADVMSELLVERVHLALTDRLHQASEMLSQRIAKALMDGEPPAAVEEEFRARIGPEEEEDD